MLLPSAPIALALSLAAPAIVLALTYRSYRAHRALNLIESLLVGAAAAVVALVLVVACAYGLHSPAGFPSAPWLLSLPLVVYAFVLFALHRRFGLSSSGSIIGGVVGLAPLWLASMLAGFLVACSFGDCI